MKNISMIMTPKKRACIIFLLSATVKFFFDIIYFFRYGWHDTIGIETYYYYGVANGTWSLSHFDITYWILHALGFFFYNETLLYAIFGVGLLISSATAVLIYMLARRILGERGGFVTALVFSFMLAPLTMGVLSFNHDLIQIPIFILFLYTGLKLEEKKSIFWAIVLILLFFIGLKINPVILLAFEILLLYYAFLYASTRTKNHERYYKTVGAMMLSISALFFLIDMGGFVLMIIRFLVDSFSGTFNTLYNIFRSEDTQANIAVYLELLGKSQDVYPASIVSLWRRFNVLWFFAPFGITSLFKKRNFFPLLILFTGFTTACVQERATRILDLGFAFIATQAITSWEKEWNRYIPYVVMATFLFALIPAIEGYFGIFNYLPYLAIFPFAYLLWKSHPKYTTIILCIFIAIQIYDLGFLPRPPLVCEAEYEAYRFIGTQKGERVLTAWDHGYAVQAVSKKLSFCSPRNLDNTYQVILMKTSEREALEILERNEIDFIVVDTSGFYLEPGGLHVFMFFKEYAPKDEEMKKTLLFKMLYQEESLTQFKKVFEKKDKYTGITVKVFIPIVRFK